MSDRRYRILEEESRRRRRRKLNDESVRRIGDVPTKHVYVS